MQGIVSTVATRLLSLSCCLVLAGSLHAQELLYGDEFNDNGKEWFTGESSDGAAKGEIEDGIYRMTYTGDGYRYFYQNVDLPVDKNWSIEIRMRQTEGKADHGYGLLWNGQDAENMYEFIVTQDGYCRIARWKEGERQDIVPWRKVRNLNPAGEWNTLEVRRTNDALTCFVNGTPNAMFPYSYYRVFGDKIAPIVHEERTVEIDWIHVKTWNMTPISVAEGVDTNVRPRNLGPNINAKSDELVDCFTADGQTLYFSRGSHPDNVGKDLRRDVWMSTRQRDGSWSKAVNLGRPINNEGHNFAIAITPDQNMMLLQNQYDANGEFSGEGMAITYRTATGWSMPKNQTIENFYNYASVLNSYLAPDGTTLIMTCERDDSKGGQDLYVLFRKNDSAWTAPVNLGSTINTAGAETAPFIAADGRTLYFASYGHPGYGGYDVFMSRRLDDTWLKWSTPINLGKGINTDEHDSFLYIPAQGDSAYFSTQKDSYGESDIVSVPVPPSLRPNPVFLVSGRVLNAETKQPLAAAIRYERLSDGKEVGIARSHPSDGRYKVSLPSGQIYGVRAEAEGFYPTAEQFDAKSLDKYTQVDRDLYLTPIKENVAIRLNNVFFDSGKWDLRSESHPELDRLASFLKTSAVSIELAGHTDNIGSDADNIQLSQNRVNSVRNYLVEKGIPASRLVAKGYGESRPLASNDDEAGRQNNRRVEFMIVKR